MVNVMSDSPDQTPAITEPRTWEMFGHAADNGVWVTVGTHNFVRLHGYPQPPKPVTVIEDPDGDYMGWLDSRPDTGVNHTDPQFIQHHRIFNVQFPYGYQAEEKAGKGTALRLRIAEETMIERDDNNVTIIDEILAVLDTGEWINPYRMSGRGYETMLLICETRIQVWPGRPRNNDPSELAVKWRFVGGPAPAWKSTAYAWAVRYIRAGLVEQTKEPNWRDWAPLHPTLAGVALLDIWRDHPFTIVEHP